MIADEESRVSVFNSGKSKPELWSCFKVVEVNEYKYFILRILSVQLEYEGRDANSANERVQAELARSCRAFGQAQPDLPSSISDSACDLSHLVRYPKRN